jgi:alpha-galactosidase
VAIPASSFWATIPKKKRRKKKSRIYFLGFERQSAALIGLGMKTMMRLTIVVVGMFGACQSLDNGLALTPPRGWRSFNAFHQSNNDTLMREQMRAVLDKSRTVNGNPTSLAELGFSMVSMDGGWPKCNCSCQHEIDPALPVCPHPNGPGSTWHNATTGAPMVNKDRFPDMQGLVDYAHSLSLKIGGYLNGCMCSEHKQPSHYEADTKWLLGLGFDGLKIDSCGTDGNVSRYAELINASGTPIEIENCHNFHPLTPMHKAKKEKWKWGNDPCPMNFYRTGGDISPSFHSILGEMYSLVQYGDLPQPISRPGCWVSDCSHCIYSHCIYSH